MKKKNLDGTTILIREGSITFIPEKGTKPWWRRKLNRKKDGFLCDEI